MVLVRIGMDRVAAFSLLVSATLAGCVSESPGSDESPIDDDDELDVQTSESSYQDGREEFRIEVGSALDAVSAEARKALPEASATTAEAAFAAAVAGDQRSFLEALASTVRPPFTPPNPPSGPDLDSCLQGSDAPGGKVFNRLMYCMTGHIGPTYVVWPFGEVGRADIDIQVVAYGRDDGQRNVKVFVRATRASRSGCPAGPSTVVRVWVDCADPTDIGCSAGGSVVAQTVSDWSGDHSWHEFTIQSNENIAAGVQDKVLRHKWVVRSQARFTGGCFFPGGETTTASFAARIIRCDSATYFRGRNAACIHDEVIPHLQYRTSEPEVDDVACHLFRAQDDPSMTWPDFGAVKLIPGKFEAGNPSAPGLHRVKYRGATYTANVAEKNRACRRQAAYADPAPGVPGRGLPAVYYKPPGQECDEYPFATTQEGAGSRGPNSPPPATFSVLGVKKSDNRCAGLALQRYYLEDRILYDHDKFFVQIHNDGSCPALDPPPPAPPEDPIVCPGEPGDFEDGAGTWDPEDI